jgi:PAS domain S-box-containing protein
VIDRDIVVVPVVPTPSSSPASPTANAELFQGGGEMGDLMRSIDWASTAVGAVETWPQSLRTVLSILLASEHPIFLWWGPELVQFYNDGYRPILGSTKHPAAMGQRGRECWKEIWPIIEPMIAKVLAGGSTYTHDGLLPLERHGFPEECYFDYAYSPVRDESGGVAGIFVACSETTGRVLSERRLMVLSSLASAAVTAASVDDICRAAADILDDAHADVPFALIYLLDGHGKGAPRLIEARGLGGVLPVLPEALFADAQRGDVEVDLTRPGERLSAVTARPWPETTTKARLIPLRSAAHPERPRGFLMAGLSPRLAFDERYRQFLQLAAGYLATGLETRFAQQQLVENDSRMRLATQATGVGIWEWNLVTNQIRWDAQMFRIYGLPPTESGFVAYEAWSAAVVPEELAQQEALLNDVVRRREHGSREFRIRRHGDLAYRHVQAVETVRVNARGEAEWVVGTNLDITDRKQTDEALRTSEARLALGVQVARLALAEVDYATGLVSLSAAAAQAYGLGNDAMVVPLDAVRATYHPDDRVELMAQLERSLDPRNAGSFGMDHRVVGPDGEVRWLNVRSQVAFDGEGDARKPLRATLAVLDVSETKRAEQQLRRLADELALADRRKDEFLATMSHELRTPLSPILGWSRILRGGARDGEQLEKGLAVIERNALTQSRLVNDLLDVSRIISGKLRLMVGPTDLAVTILAAADVVRPAAEAKRVRLVLELAPDLGTTIADPDRVQQITWNLLSNAVRFTPTGGAVTISAERTRHAVRIRVKDTGAGIPRPALPFVFDRFRQVDSSTTRAHGGLGLGLAIVRYLVEAHGGTVMADSEGLGLGATFEVTLPLRAVASSENDLSLAPPPPEEVASPLRTGAGALRGVRALIVDDDDDSLVLLREVLERAGATVTAAANAYEGLEHREAVDIIISDIAMPGMDGYAFVRHIKARDSTSKVPAIALTAYASPADAERAREAGYQEHLAKPIDNVALVDAVQRWTRR